MPTVLLEINYRARREEGVERARRLARTMRQIDHLLIELPTSDIALHAAELRDNYHQRRSLELSYADAVHIATAIATECDRLYSGDPDFANVSEVPTVVIRYRRCPSLVGRRDTNMVVDVIDVAPIL